MTNEEAIVEVKRLTNTDLQEKLREDQLVRDKRNLLNVRVQNACILHTTGVSI